MNTEVDNVNGILFYQFETLEELSEFTAQEEKSRDVTKPPLMLEKCRTKELNIEETEILAIYKMMGSGNVFYLELSSNINNVKDFSLSV